MSKSGPRILVTLIVFALALGGLVWWWQAREGADGAVKYRTAKLERGPVIASVAASGTVTAVVTVQVGSQISGQIRELRADFNTQVKKDQVIARIDPATYELRVKQAEADLSAAQSAVAVARANLAAQQAQLALTRANLADAKRDFERKESLIARGFLSPAERDKAATTLTTATEQVRGVEAQNNVAAAQVEAALAQVSQRESALSQARVDLDRTYIRAPVDGVVISRNIDAGQTVAASLQAPTLFTIAQDLARMQVEAAIDEADVGRLSVGQKATFTVDAFSGRSFSGEVQQVRKAAQNVQNVITYTVVISAANVDLRLLPGMTANVRIVTDERDSVLKFPNAALRFRPPGSDGRKETAPASTAAAAGGAANGAGGSAMQTAQIYRQRVMSELDLDVAQKSSVEQIFADARQKFIGLRDLADEGERRKAGERLRGEVRARVAAVLKPSQKAAYERILAELAGRAASGRVWILDAGGKPKTVEVKLGLSDGSATELVGGDLKEGDEIIIGTIEIPKKSVGGPRAL